MSCASYGLLIGYVDHCGRDRGGRRLAERYLEFGWGAWLCWMPVRLNLLGTVTQAVCGGGMTCLHRNAGGVCR
jgi:hypothetical protein